MGQSEGLVDGWGPLEDKSNDRGDHDNIYKSNDEGDHDSSYNSNGIEDRGWSNNSNDEEDRDQSYKLDIERNHKSDDEKDDGGKIH